MYLKNSMIQMYKKIDYANQFHYYQNKVKSSDHLKCRSSTSFLKIWKLISRSATNLLSMKIFRAKFKRVRLKFKCNQPRNAT